MLERELSGEAEGWCTHRSSQEGEEWEGGGGGGGVGRRRRRRRKEGVGLTLEI